MRQSGFTLIEMMVVIGIIGILAAVLTGGYTYAVKSARRAKATEAVSNARTALEMLYQRAEGWPQEIIDARQEGDYQVMDDKVARVLFKYGLLNVDCKKVNSTGQLEDDYKLRGADRCGIADPWAQEVLKSKSTEGKDGAALLDFTVSTGGKVRDHLIYFAVDQNDDGFVERGTDGAVPVKKVRAKVITWCAGPDGGLGDCSTDKRGKASVNGRTVSNGDNVYSWQRAQEVR